MNMTTRQKYMDAMNRRADLLAKADGRILTKRRYEIPIEGTALTIELDIFSGVYEGLILAEVEFPTEEEALAFVPPSWFGREVTYSGEYQNSVLAMKDAE